MVNYKHQCAIKLCKTNKKHRKNCELQTGFESRKSFFLFPQSKIRKESWVENLIPSDILFQRRKLYICEDHFLRKDIIYKNRKRIRPNAVPHIVVKGNEDSTNLPMLFGPSITISEDRRPTSPITQNVTFVCEEKQLSSNTSVTIIGISECSPESPILEVGVPCSKYEPTTLHHKIPVEQRITGTGRVCEHYVAFIEQKALCHRMRKEYDERLALLSSIYAKGEPEEKYQESCFEGQPEDSHHDSYLEGQLEENHHESNFEFWP